MRVAFPLLRRRRQPAEPAPDRLAAGHMDSFAVPHRTLSAPSPEPAFVLDAATAPPLADQPIAIHAYRLLIWVEERAGEEILASELAAIYRELCAELWWRSHRWEGRNGVAQYVRALGGHDKVYRWFTYPDGSRHRLHVYPIARPELRRSRPKRATVPTPKRAFQTPRAAAA